MKTITIREATFDELSSKITANIIEKILPHLNTKNEEKYLTRKETAKFLKISLPTLHSWTKSGRLKSYRVVSSNRIRYKRSEVLLAVKEIPYLKNNIY